MELSKEAILYETCRGINIYAWILRQFYPGEIVLYEKGDECRLTKNPFAGDKPTLKIEVVKNRAYHYDYTNSVPPGDVFDFAAFYYKLEGAQLLQKIHDEMNLRIVEKPKTVNQSFIPQQTSRVLIDQPLKKPPEFSFFRRPISNVLPYRTISLTQVFELLRSDRYKERTLTLRSLLNHDNARSFKATCFDYVTFSGIFHKRSDRQLVTHSGLMTIDFDHVPRHRALRHKLLTDEHFQTEMLFVSPSGDGLKWIIQVDLSEVSHQEYFKAVSAYIREKYKLSIDTSGKDISRACYLPYDPDVYVNPDYLTYKNFKTCNRT